MARVQREVLGSLNCSSCLAMFVNGSAVVHRIIFTPCRYNLGAFLLVHRSSQHDEAASLLRSAHSVSREGIEGPKAVGHIRFFTLVFTSVATYAARRDGL